MSIKIQNGLSLPVPITIQDLPIGDTFDHGGNHYIVVTKITNRHSRLIFALDLLTGRTDKIHEDAGIQPTDITMIVTRRDL